MTDIYVRLDPKAEDHAYPVCPASSAVIVAPSRPCKLYTEQMLSRPPQATKSPEGAKAQVMTHEERRGMA